MFYEFLGQFLDPGSKNLYFGGRIRILHVKLHISPAGKVWAPNIWPKNVKKQNIWFNFGRIYVWATDRSHSLNSRRSRRRTVVV